LHRVKRNSCRATYWRSTPRMERNFTNR